MRPEENPDYEKLQRIHQLGTHSGVLHQQHCYESLSELQADLVEAVAAFAKFWASRRRRQTMIFSSAPCNGVTNSLGAMTIASLLSGTWSSHSTAAEAEVPASHEPAPASATWPPTASDMETWR
jgi:hypothetical protein